MAKIQAERELRPRELIRHPLSPIARRSLWAVFAILTVMLIGTVGMRLLSGWAWLESFYFMAMIATAEGPPEIPPNAYASIFAAIMAFVSIGTLVTSVGIIFGPLLGYLFHKGIHFSQKEIEKFEEARREKQKQTS